MLSHVGKFCEWKILRTGEDVRELILVSEIISGQISNPATSGDHGR